MEEYTVELQKDSKLFSTIIIKVRLDKKTIFLNKIADIQEILIKNDVNLDNVLQYKFKRKIDEIKLEIEYCQFNLQEIFEVDSPKEQCISFLKILGYSEEEIDVDDSNKKLEIKLKKDYDLDESLSAQSDEIYIIRTIKKVLDIDVDVRFVSGFYIRF